MKCNKYQAPVLCAKTPEQRDKEVERHQIIVWGIKKMIEGLEENLASERDASRAKWLRGNIRHEKLMMRRYEEVVRKLEALTF